MQKSCHILTTQMEPHGSIKSSASNQIEHIELSLCLSFYLRHSIVSYMAGTTVGYPVKIMEALAPQSHHRTPWKCLW
jgi:hypothetical protein